MFLRVLENYTIFKPIFLLKNLRWSIVLLISIISGIGFIMLYSAANGHLMPWALPQMIRFLIGVLLMIGISAINIRFWRHLAYLFYGGSFLLLLAVEIIGNIGMGAQRWINVGFFNIQPSELMKIALILALARYFSALSVEEIQKPKFLLLPLFMILMPAMLVAKQPDLGTALLLIMIGAGILFTAGVKVRYFVGLGFVSLCCLPLAWCFLKSYQKNRILIFLNPEKDPLKSGYHILQSKIALGSGGIFGKGFQAGTQSHLNFLPEKQTDFIFTMFSEEFGFIGAICLLSLYFLLMLLSLKVGLESRDRFGKFIVMGVLITVFVYVFINTSMVMGLVPVVGVPLPFVSYGGTALLTLLMSFGFLLGVDLQKHRKSMT
ncbi:MAG: rod shape-determining protein RodA [Proteobacteria bacterium]|nr:rod shape-determining protein RodA [Pseudomonadota bacterium]